MNNAAELRKKSDKELQELLIALRREQFNLRMQQGASKPHLFGQARRNIAKVKTVLNERRKTHE